MPDCETHSGYRPPSRSSGEIRRGTVGSSPECRLTVIAFHASVDATGQAAVCMDGSEFAPAAAPDWWGGREIGSPTDPAATTAVAGSAVDPALHLLGVALSFDLDLPGRRGDLGDVVDAQFDIGGGGVLE